MALDTTAGSVVHYLLGYLDRVWPKGEFDRSKLYIFAIAVAFLPLLFSALLSPIPLFAPSPPEHPLPFFRDWNMLFLFIVSFPAILILTATDQRFLVRALKEVKSAGTLTISDEEKDRLALRWYRRFLNINIVGQGVGILIGICLAYSTIQALSLPQTGHFIVHDGKLLPVGFVYLYCIFLFYTLLFVYMVRIISISLLLRDIVAHSRLKMLPLHPDNCGGLGPVGRIGLRNEYALTLLGINVVLFLLVDSLYLHVSFSLAALMAAAVIAYLAIAPFVFLAPLLPFRSAMERNKSELIAPVVQRIRKELDRLPEKLSSGQSCKDDKERLEELRKIRDVIDELPVWPLDSGTLTKFATAYMVPIIIPILTGSVVALAKYIAGLITPI
jgi:hypothetical protein